VNDVRVRNWPITDRSTILLTFDCD